MRRQRAAAHVPFELGDVDAIFCERQCPVAVLQAYRQVGRDHRGIDDVDGAGDVWTVRGAVGVDVELELTGSPQVGIEELRKVQIDGAEKEKRHWRVARRGNGSLELQIGVGAADRRALHVDDLVLVIDVNGRGGSELHGVAIGQLEHRDGDVRFELLLVLEWAVKRGVELSLAGDVCGLIGCVDREERAERNALRVEGGVGEIVAGERHLCIGLDGCVDRRGSELGGSLMIGEVGLQTNVGDGMLLHDKAGDLDSRVELRIVESALAFRVDADYACGT